jgi:hypothetical protein
MKLVRDRPDTLIEINEDKLKFFYSHIDGWVPLSFYDNMKKTFPRVAVLLEDKKIEHGFVEHFDQSLLMAEICAKEIDKNNNILKL